MSRGAVQGISMTSKRKTEPKADPAAMPLFYKEPRRLLAQAHGDLCLKGERDFRFAASANAVPLMTPEFVEAQRSYPIVFVGEPAHPVAVLGLERANLFVSADGAWAADRYIPAYVRRYPFVFVETGEGAKLALGVDVASDRVVAAPGGGEGLSPLFVGAEPSPLTQEALRFCAALTASQQDTQAFCAALAEQELLVDQRAQGAFPGGEPFNVQGFRIVDAARLQALPDRVVLEWRRKGWLTLIDFHLASLSRWGDLLARQGGASQPLQARTPSAELADA